MHANGRGWRHTSSAHRSTGCSGLLSRRQRRLSWPPFRRGVDLIGPFTFRLPGLVMAALFTIPGREQERFLRLAAAISWGLVGGERVWRQGSPRAGSWKSGPPRGSGSARRGGAPDDLLQWLVEPDAVAALLDERLHPNERQLPFCGRRILDRRLRAAERALGALCAPRSDADADSERATLESLDRSVFTEAMRFAPPVPYEGRIVTTGDVEWHGQVVPEGSIVRVALASATNDETVFVDPRRFDPARPDLWPADSRGGIRREGAASHLAFGLGSHFCAGYKLSRLEAHEGIVRLFRDRRPVLAEPLPPLRLHQFHLTIPCLRVTLANGGSR